MMLYAKLKKNSGRAMRISYIIVISGLCHKRLSQSNPLCFPQPPDAQTKLSKTRDIMDSPDKSAELLEPMKEYTMSERNTPRTVAY